MRDFNLFLLGVSTGMLVDLIIDVLTFIRRVKNGTIELKFKNEKAGN